MQTRSKTQPLSTKSNTIWNAAGCFFYLGCQWLTTILVVLLSSNYENSGVLAFAMSTGNMFAAVGLYKIRTFQVSDVNSEYSPNDYAGFRILTIAVSAIATIIFLVLGTGLNAFTIASIVYLLFKADETFNDVFFGIEQKAFRMDYIGKSQFLRGIATIVGFSVPLAICDSLLASILGMAALCISITFFYDRRNATLFGFTKPSISKKNVIRLVRACFLPTVANLLATSIVSMARQQYGITNGEEMLGIYASIATPAVLVQAAATYLYSPLIGRLAQTLSNIGLHQFRKSLIKTIMGMIAVITVICLLVSNVGIWGLPILFGKEIEAYVWIFPFVLISTGCIALLYFTNDMLIIIRKGVPQLAINSIALISSLTLLGPLTNMCSMNGINLAIIIGSSLATILGISYICFNRKL